MNHRMSHRSEILPPGDMARLIRCIRGRRVILDHDLAVLYGVPTKRLNEQYRRNLDRFPDDFAFRVTQDESRADQAKRSQFATASKRNVRYLPVAFTEHGALMAANVLNSPRAVAMSVYVIRAFIKMREDLAANAAILKRLAEIDRTLLSHDAALREIFQQLRPLLAPPPEPPKPEIGFHVKEDALPYRVKRNTSRT
jgi:hypothetical protein